MLYLEKFERITSNMGTACQQQLQQPRYSTPVKIFLLLFSCWFGTSTSTKILDTIVSQHTSVIHTFNLNL